MEGRTPPDDSDPFEWEDTPPERPRRRRSHDPFETGEDEPFETGEREELKRPLPRPGDPYEPRTSEREAYDTGEGEGLSTGDRELLDTGEREAYDAGELDFGRDPFDTDERERRRAERRRARETGEHGIATGEHRRRRDLPARVRRRQAIGLGAIVAAVLVGGYVLASGGGDDDGQEGPALKKLAGQTIVAPMDQAGPNKDLLRQARTGRIGGLIIVTDEGKGLNPNQLQADIARVQKAARSGGNPTLLVMTDQEGGFVKRLEGPPDIPPNDLGEEGDPTVATAEGQKTGQFLAPIGINVDLAPLLDVTIPQTADTIRTRTFGDDPAVVSEIGVAFIQGLQEAGVSATAKHFPGLGLSTVNTDFRRVDIVASAGDQEAALAPFEAGIDAGVDLVMMSSAIYPDLAPETPAVFAPEIVQGQLRETLGFDGLVITDDLNARAIADGNAPGEAAVAALNAGNDLLLYGTVRRSAAQALQGIIRASKKGGIDEATIQDAYDRVTAFKAGVGGE